MKTILVSDDNSDIRDSIKIQFERMGYNVITAFDALKLVDKLKRILGE